MTNSCGHCGGPLPRYPEWVGFQENGADRREWFCTWRCAVLWRAALGDPEAERVAETMGFDGGDDGQAETQAD